MSFDAFLLDERRSRRVACEATTEKQRPILLKAKTNCQEVYILVAFLYPICEIGRTQVDNT